MASKPQPPAASVDSRVSSSAVESAVNALLKYKAAHSSTGKLQLLPQDDYIYLNLTLKKIPNPRTNPFRIPLSHPILDASSQICLIIDDRPQTTTPPSEEIKKLIKSQNIPISKVIKISKLKTNYKPFEAKRKLCDSYDLFLVDKRVVHLLPKLIGKQFFKKKKLPLGVDLHKSNLKLQVERALGSALLYLRTGTCCVMKVGKVAMEKDEVVENVIDAIKGAVERVPKKWDGVRSLHLKFYDSVALPIYQAMPDVKLKIEGLKEIEKRAEIVAKISDSEGEVKETSGRKDGKTGKKKKGRIHEVRYMDVGEDMESGDDVDEIEQVRSEDNDGDSGEKMKGNLMEDSDDDEEDKDESEIGVEDISTNGTLGKKRNKGRALKNEVVGTLNGEKRVKKKPKSEKSGYENAKKDDVSGGEVSGGKKGKKKSELGQRRSERIAKVKDAKPKKKVSAK
ncbi:UNVERIFIED_CONTAM: Ribosomal L1 domain-containing protein 1 [Sesamum radiatum]|uniref:Ribosomal L1 domain-containing protein 1 n=1 Tax=Sesamum radiatum TaxID=300843 RepID=A0AAW2T409_SESRA